MLSDLLYRLRALLRVSAVERELDDEIRFHLDRETQKYMKSGMTTEEAARRARFSLGGLEKIKEESRDARGIMPVENFVRNLRIGIRVLSKSPGFAIVAILSLGLGIGANTAIFQLQDAVRLRMLPVKDPQQLVDIQMPDMKAARGNFQRYPGLTNPIWEQIRDRQTILSGVAAWGAEGFDTSTEGEPRLVHGLWVSGRFFDVLGISPSAGRLFSARDDRRGCGLPGAVISDAYWHRQFGAQRSALGSTVMLAGHPVQVIGITPAGFYGMEVGESFDVALPLCSEAVLHGSDTRLDSATNWWLDVVGRAPKGMTLAKVSAYFDALAPTIFRATLAPNYPPVSVKPYLASRLTAIPVGNGESDLRESYSNPLLFLQAIAGVVLLIACANLANLMLARASARERDIALRLAIGASRGHIIAQLMTESLLIASAGTILGLLLATRLSGLLLALLSTESGSVAMDVHPDWLVLAFTAGLGVLTCLLFGLTPALRATREASAESLKTSGRGLTANRQRFGLRRMLVASQMALSLVLIIGALLFVRTLNNLSTLNPGFQPDGVLIAGIGFDGLNFPKERIPSFRRNLIEKLQAIPGVTSVADTSAVPLSTNRSSNTMWMEGTTADHGAEVLRANVGVDYFKTLATPLLAGRNFNDNDTPSSPRVAIVNETFARKLVGGANPVGKKFTIESTPSEPETQVEIVGLVKDTKYVFLREPFQRIAFFAMAQTRQTNPYDEVLIRSNLPMDQLTAGVKLALQDISPAIRFRFQVLRTEIQESLLPERLMAALSSAFGLLAGLLAAVGLYGVIAYAMVQRQHEIGIRMALGAKARNILTMVLLESGEMLAVGVVAGIALALAAGTMARSLLFGLSPSDPVAIAMAVCALALIALLATYIPARRAASLDPLKALREE